MQHDHDSHPALPLAPIFDGAAPTLPHYGGVELVLDEATLYIMNALFRLRPDLYEFATGAIWDPFYKDENLTEFWHKIYDQFIMTMDN